MGTKRMIALLLAVACIMGLSACTTSSEKSFTYKVDNGDQVEVKLDTSGGDFGIQTAENGFEITKDKNVVVSAVLGYDLEWSSLYEGDFEIQKDSTDTIHGTNTRLVILTENASGDTVYVSQVADCETVVLLRSSDPSVLEAAYKNLTFTFVG